MTGTQLKFLLWDKRWTILALITFLVLVGSYLFWGGKSGTDELEDDISGQKGVNAVITNQIANQEGVVNNAANDSKEAETNFNSSVNRDSNSFHGNSTDSFCKRFVCDSTCAEWRATHRPGLDCR